MSRFNARKVMPRYFFIVIVLTLLGIAIVGKAFYIMTAQKDYWQTVQNQLKHDSIPVPPSRGNILSCDGQLMASSIPEYKIYMDFQTGGQERDSLWQLKLDSICIGLNDIFPEMSKEDKVKFDSLVQTLMIPVEYGFTLKRDFTAQSVGGPPRKRALDEESPVEYPRLKRYTEWHVFNGALVFSRSSRSNPKKEMELVNDTAELVMLRGDTLVLRFADHLQGFSRKPDSLATKN